MDTRTTWRVLIGSALDEAGESWDDVVSVVVGSERPWGFEEDDDWEPSLDQPFEAGYGRSEGARFTLWTRDRVYFPVMYDGMEWVSSAPRNPCEEAMAHVGGG